MNYDAEIARLVDVYSSKVSKITGKPEHRKQGAMRLMTEMADAIKKLVREGTLRFYEESRKGPAPSPLMGENEHSRGYLGLPENKTEARP